jgi:hypothetical protein
MTIQLTPQAMRQIFPRAPQAVFDAFVAKQSVLDAAGITHTRPAYFFANIEHESGGFTIPNLTENIRYTAERMAQVWPNSFASAAAVRAKYGAADGSVQGFRRHLRQPPRHAGRIDRRSAVDGTRRLRGMREAQLPAGGGIADVNRSVGQAAGSLLRVLELEGPELLCRHRQLRRRCEGLERRRQRPCRSPAPDGGQ